MQENENMVANHEMAQENDNNDIFAETTGAIVIGDEEPTKTRFQEFIDFFRDVIVILIVVLIVRTYIAAPFQISGDSMKESYYDREFILVNKFSYADFGIFTVGDPVR